MCIEIEMKALAKTNSVDGSQGWMAMVNKDLDEDDNHSSSYSNVSIVDDSSGDELAS